MAGSKESSDSSWPKLMQYVDLVFNTPLQQSFTYLLPEALDGDFFGRRVQAAFGKKTITGFVVKQHNETPVGNFTLKTIDKIIDEEALFTRQVLETAQWLADYYFCSVGEALSAMLPGGKRESRMALWPDTDDALEFSRHTLSDEQIAAISGIIKSNKRFFYLNGITGSGKTEVFLQLTEYYLSRDKAVIYLVPEIALTHQLLEELKLRFQNRIALLHSGLTPSQKYLEWRRILSGEAQLVVGARSAVFAPCKNLGLIIIDEEHENSYKSGNTPRYHARQVAMYRSSKEQAKLLMGSATPSLEGLYWIQNAVIQEFRLSQRLAGGALPDVKIVNMQGESSIISQELHDALLQTRQEDRQSILFLNRRGYTYFFHCKSCGYHMSCPHCSVALTYHKHKNRLQCHYCGAIKMPIDICPDCKSLDVGYSGFGTELVEDELKRLFPHFRVARLDSDTVRKKGELQKLLDEFHKGSIDVLLGTQMVAKGLNFPKVKLVGIVLADTSLNVPDFRAAERTFSLIVQVAGRAGRFADDGKVLVQTYKPQNKAILWAAENRIKEFVDDELATRELLGFPPFSRLIRFVFRSRKVEKAANAADFFQKLLDSALTKNEEILGPSECPLAVISGNYRYHIVIQSKTFSSTITALHAACSRYKQEQNVYMEVDVDPLSLM